jgi:phosphotriesterase-related protein
MTSDSQRINDVKQLIEDGYLNRLLLSSDHCMKIRLAAYGGRGYAHILENILRVMRAKGISDEQFHTMLVENPKRILQFAPRKG